MPGTSKRQERFTIQTQITLDQASGVSCIPVTTPSYIFAVIQLFGQVQQTRFHAPEPEIVFSEEIGFEAQFELSWNADDIKYFLKSTDLVRFMSQFSL